MAKRDSYTLTDADVIAMNTPEVRAKLGKKMRRAVDKHYAKITAELARFEELSPVDRVRHAAVFSVISPLCKIEVNTIVTPMMVKRMLHGNVTQDQIMHLLLAWGIGLHNNKSKYLFHNVETLRNLNSSDMDRDHLVKMLMGIDMKTASMTLALYDPNRRIYTLDTHMLRGLRELAGLPKEMGVHAAGGKGRYEAIEALYLDVYDEYCSDVPVFVSQWALWNDFGFDGTHQCHLAIFGLSE